MRRSTKIVATIGPVSSNPQTIRSLIAAGMNVARLNFSHGDHETHAGVITMVRAEAEALGQSVAILQDLQGPKIRTGKLRDGQIELTAGDPLVLTTEDLLGDTKRIHVDFEDLPLCLSPGSRVLLADGNLELVVQQCSGTEVLTRVVEGGILKSNQGINLPGVKLDIRAFTEKDEKDLAFGLQHGVDAVAMSFVRSARDVARLRAAIASLDPSRIRIPIIAKLERPEALENLEEIVTAADGVMVARGDLGVEMATELVPIAQKRIIESANRHSRVVITATQMLESMLENPRPTRAEASDVANAIFDGTDAVMLSGETAVGKYPVKTVETMAAIVRQAEEHLSQWGHWRGLPDVTEGASDALYLCRAATALAQDRNVAGIAVFTKTGSTALLMSKARPGVPILAFTSDRLTYNRMSLLWGVVPHLVPFADSMEKLTAHVEAGLLAETPVELGQQVVLICGFPVDKMRPSNLVLLHTVGG